MNFHFRHQVNTSRRYVFENIMDLDHVCSLHKKWFRNLRLIVQKPGYVEYRLTSLFYGLKQEIRVRGGPVDSDSYWYEFIAPLATMRVDGRMEGPDGSLSQIETITFQFHWFLAPVFWLLRPLFRRQKEDILRDDTALLERVYQLENSGFRRLELEAPRIVIYGGNGFFGRLLVKDLLQFSSAQIIIASRSAKIVDFHPHEDRIRWVQSDLHDPVSVAAALEGAHVLVSCTGPFQGQSLNLLRACIEKKIPYVDIADDRDFVQRCHQLRTQVEQARIPALVGCSVVPGMSSLLTQFCREQVPVIERTKICITPGTRHPRGPGSFLCLLSTVGREFSIPVNGANKTVRGWTGHETVNFPPPLGRRSVYFVVDIADYFLQPLLFGTKTVEFRIGSELDLLNRSLSALAGVRRLVGFDSFGPLLSLSRTLVTAASLLGTSQGAVMVEVSGPASEGSRKFSLCVWAESHGEIIPAVLPSIVTQMVLAGEFSSAGLVPSSTLLSRERFAQELEKRHIRLSCKSDNSAQWQPFP